MASIHKAITDKTNISSTDFSIDSTTNDTSVDCWHKECADNYDTTIDKGNDQTDDVKEVDADHHSAIHQENDEIHTKSYNDKSSDEIYTKSYTDKTNDKIHTKPYNDKNNDES